jgi:hypothetical protein
MSAATCYVCGHLSIYWTGPDLPPSMTLRDGHVVCVDVQACTDRVMRPPPPLTAECGCLNDLFPREWCGSFAWAEPVPCSYGKPTKAEWERQNSVWFEGV